MDGLHDLIEFDDNSKWFVAAEKVIDGIKYSYLVRVNDSEDDFLDEYQLAKSITDGGHEYMEPVKDREEEKRIIANLIPEALNIADVFKK